MEKATRCPICGVRVSPTDDHCPNCKNPLLSDYSSAELVAKERKRILSRSYFNVFFFGIIIVVIWEVLAHFIPEGWGMAVVNILAFLVSIWVFWWPLFGFMKVTMPTWLATLASLLCWVFLFVIVRSLIGAIF